MHYVLLYRPTLLPLRVSVLRVTFYVQCTFSFNFCVIDVRLPCLYY